ncbi:MAG: DNA polymerase I [Clostridia bacterium]|nr:DNA polymerase I [Clostridia bacterium]
MASLSGSGAGTKTGIVFDGNSILNRAFYGVRPLSNRAGLPTNALFGFVNIIRKAMDETKPGYAVMTFDLKAPTFRHKAHDYYKATRHGMPEDLARQMPYARKLAVALGLRVVEREGYEADDVLGTVSRLFSERGIDCVLVTGDRDSYQLIDGHVTVHLAATNETRIMGVPQIREQYGVEPRQLIDVKAVMGDTSDNIPGVPGIGEKGALKLIAEYGTLDGIYDHIGEIKGSLHDKLEAGKELAYQSRFLAEICRTVPVPEDPEEYAYSGPDVPALRDLYTELEFRRFLEQLEESVPAAEAVEEAPGAEFQPGGPEVLGDPGASVYADDRGVFVFGEAGGTFLEWFRAGEWDWRNGWPEGKRILTWSVKELLHALWDHGIDADLAGKADDLSLMAYLLSPEDNGITYAGTYFKCFSKTVKDPPDPSRFPALRDVLAAGMKKPSAEGKDSPLERLYEDIELPLAHVLANMEKCGFRVDADGLRAFGETLAEEMRACEDDIFRMAGHSFNINSPKQLGTVLFEERNLPHFKKTKSGYSTDAETLEKLSQHDPLVRRVLDYRKAAKLKSTYCDGLLKVISSDGRVHTTFKQTMTMTGRLSSAEPNLQNIPVRTEKGRELRKFFTAEDGWTLIDADYSQIELRLLAHLSGDPDLIEAFRSGEDIHAATAAQVFGVPLEEVTKENRKFAKTINFGIIYGMGEYSLSQDLGIPVWRAKEYIASYFARYPRISEYMEHCRKSAAETGYAETLFGRRREIPELRESNKLKRAFGERVAMNTPIQGAAADLIKIAMILVDRRLRSEGLRARLILQIHDELIVEAPKDEEETARRILEEEMTGAAHLDVPLVAEASSGRSWFEAKE